MPCGASAPTHQLLAQSLKRTFQLFCNLPQAGVESDIFIGGLLISSYMALGLCSPC